ncbi:MAG: tetratricopeptide repeat protein [Beijerinckiaceae bacterium]
MIALGIAAAVVAAHSPARAQDFTTGLHAYESGDYATAFGNWWPLALKGDAKAQASLGLLYYAGRAVPRDYSKALLWFSRAAEAGQPTAQFFMGLLYYFGKGVPKDLGRAHAWCDIAVTNGYMDSLFCRDAIEVEMTEADKKASDKFSSEFYSKHKFRN